MSLSEYIFFAFSGMTALSAVALVLSRKMAYAVFFFFALLVCVAALFVFAGSEFLAVTQIIVYVGGILILFLFGVMLIQKGPGEEPRADTVNLLPGLLVAGLLGAGIVWMVLEFGSREPTYINEFKADFSAKGVGASLVSRWLLPFEAISILLLGALIGAATLIRRKPEKEEAP